MSTDDASDCLNRTLLRTSPLKPESHTEGADSWASVGGLRVWRDLKYQTRFDVLGTNTQAD